MTRPKTSLHLAERLFIALDVPTGADALALCSALQPVGLRAVKVGMSLFYREGLPLLRQLKAMDLTVFVDLKLHDIPSTVARTVSTLVEEGVSFLNVHALGGLEMMQQAGAAALNTSQRLGLEPPTVIAVTLLTSHSQHTLQHELALQDTCAVAGVLRLAKLTQQAGLAGVVCSPQEAAAVREACGETFLKVTPGIRLSQTGTSDDQVRIAGPAEAFAAGATHLVVGRPVYASANPAQAFETLLLAASTASVGS